MDDLIDKLIAENSTKYGIKKKKHKREKLLITQEELLSPVQASDEIENKKHKHTRHHETDLGNSVLTDSCTKRKRKKHLADELFASIAAIPEQEKHDIKTAIEQSTKKVKKKKKRHLDETEFTIPEQSMSEINPATENVRKKKKKKRKDSTISEPDVDYTPKEEKRKKRERMDSIISERDSGYTPKEEKMKKKKHNDSAASKLNDDYTPKKEKKKKNGDSPTNEVNTDYTLKEDEVKKVKKKKKHDDSITCEPDADYFLIKDKVKKKRRRDSSESDAADTPEEVTVKKKRRGDSTGIKYHKLEVIKDAIDMALDNEALLKEESLKVQGDFHVFLPFIVPESHMIETRLSTAPSADQRQQFKALNIKMKTGQYTMEEDEQIRTNFEDFCKVHSIPCDATPFLIFDKRGLSFDERIKFGQFLGRNLPHRMIHSVYRRFKVLYKYYIRGKFTDEEDKIILTYVRKSKSARKFSELATLLCRSRDAVTKRFATLEYDEKVVWSLNTSEKLIEQLLTVTEKKTVEQLKNYQVTLSEWQQIETEMNIPVIKLRRKWELELYPKLFNDVQDLRHIHVKLVNKLCELPPYDRRSVDWNELSKDFNGITAKRLNKIFFDLCQNHVPRKHQENFKDLIFYLRDEYLAQKTPMRNVPKLRYVDGKLLKSSKND